MIRISGAIRRLARHLPGNLIRSWLYYLGGVSLGKGVLTARDLRVGSSVSIGQSARIATDVTIGDSAVLGEGIEVQKGAVIGGRVVIGDGASIGEYSRLYDCKIGDHSFVELGVIFTGIEGGWITVGRHCYLGIYSILDGSGGLEIGDYVHIAGPSVGIFTHSSVNQSLFGDQLEDRTKTVTAPVHIESNVWIGGNTTIYPGITIGHHSIVLPNSVVNSDVSSYSMVGGVPANLKRRIEMGAEQTRFSRVESLAGG